MEELRRGGGGEHEADVREAGDVASSSPGLKNGDSTLEGAE